MIQKVPTTDNHVPTAKIMRSRVPGGTILINPFHTYPNPFTCVPILEQDALFELQ